MFPRTHRHLVAAGRPECGAGGRVGVGGVQGCRKAGKGCKCTPSAAQRRIRIARWSNVAHRGRGVSSARFYSGDYYGSKIFSN